jgi:hypothetical protein
VADFGFSAPRIWSAETVLPATATPADIDSAALIVTIESLKRFIVLSSLLTPASWRA